MNVGMKLFGGRHVTPFKKNQFKQNWFFFS